MTGGDEHTGRTEWRDRRRDLVQALTDQTWVRPEMDRPVARPHVTVLITVATVVLAVLAGVVLQVVWPVKLARADGPAAPVPTRVTAHHYAAIAGWDCTSGTSHGFRASGRNADWYTVGSGGWLGDGCDGTYEAVPMSGDPAKDDPGQSAVWWFSPGAAIHQCALEVYLPGPGSTGVGAAAARYSVLADQSGPALAEVTVDQGPGHGGWHRVGVFPVNQGTIAVQLGNRGKPATTTARLAVTQVRATCTN
jgi:hypothetical protein